MKWMKIVDSFGNGRSKIDWNICYKFRKLSISREEVGSSPNTEAGNLKLETRRMMVNCGKFKWSENVWYHFLVPIQSGSTIEGEKEREREGKEGMKRVIYLRVSSIGVGLLTILYQLGRILGTKVCFLFIF